MNYGDEDLSKNKENVTTVFRCSVLLISYFLSFLKYIISRSENEGHMICGEKEILLESFLIIHVLYQRLHSSGMNKTVTSAVKFRQR